VLKEGSTFWFTIPVKSAQPEVPQAQLSIDWTQKHIFLLSKGEHLTKLLSSTLSSRGAKVSVADAPVTPDQLKEWSIDYIVAVDAALTTEASLQMLSIFAAERGAATVVTLLSPASLRLREQCTKMKLPNLLPLPVVSQDVLDSLAGTYVAETQDDCGF
jgi:ActR/RegA family two-component response regulator